MKTSELKPAVLLLKIDLVLLLYSHDHYTYTYTCRNIFNTIRTSEDSSLEKYISHFIERVVCERELETEQNCNILTPSLMAIIAFLSHSPGMLNRAPGGSASLGHGPHSSIFSPTVSSSNKLPVHRVISLFYAHSIQHVDSQGYLLDIFDRMHLLFTQGHFLF